MKQYQQLMRKVIDYNTLDGGGLVTRQTRSGEVISMPNHTLNFNLQDGFPVVTVKQLSFKNVVGELLFFLSGKTGLDSLCHYSDKPSGSKTIWTADAERWGGACNKELGAIYSKQWRDFGGTDTGNPYEDIEGVDQITNLIKGLKEDPYSRYHLVSAWNPSDKGKQALPACHYSFQIFVDEDEHGFRYIDLHWNQRSCDLALGLPYNIASYATLLYLLSKITGYLPRNLSCHIMDAHLYLNQLPQVRIMLEREPKELCGLVVRGRIKTLEDILGKTAKDFNLVDYLHCGKLSIPLSVGR